MTGLSEVHPCTGVGRARLAGAGRAATGRGGGSNARPAPDELREHVAGQLARFKVRREIRFTDALPRDPNGNLVKRLLRESG